MGADWDAAHFVATLQAARVNSITLFAKGHHGLTTKTTGQSACRLTRCDC